MGMGVLPLATFSLPIFAVDQQAFALPACLTALIAAQL